MPDAPKPAPFDQPYSTETICDEYLFLLAICGAVVRRKEREKELTIFSNIFIPAFVSSSPSLFGASATGVGASGASNFFLFVGGSG